MVANAPMLTLTPMVGEPAPHEWTKQSGEPSGELLILPLVRLGAE